MKTIRARILLVITDDGAYYAEGTDKLTRRELIASTNETLRGMRWTPPFEFYWIEAEVPVPPPLAPRRLVNVSITNKGTSRRTRRPR